MRPTGPRRIQTVMDPYERARLKTKCNVLEEILLHGKALYALNIEERTMIQTEPVMAGICLKPAVLVRSLNRSAATLARELRRNG
ncbi:MAG: hypothetical protein ACYCS1_11890 [Gammaproteobacteria bacterium]